MVKGAWMVVACAMLLCAGTAQAGLSARQQCEQAKLKAQGARQACMKKNGARITEGRANAAAAACQTKFAAAVAMADADATKAHASCRYIDNRDGTVSDLSTGLMWEKKIKLDGMTDVANLHDADNCYPWTGTCLKSGAPCSVTAECRANGPCQTGDCQVSFPNGLTVIQWIAQLNTAKFAGHADWRVPDKTELESILGTGNTGATSAVAFNGLSCGARCTDIKSASCSCTVSGYYFSSSSIMATPRNVWLIGGHGGYVTFDVKGSYFYVRAVRGGGG